MDGFVGHELEGRQRGSGDRAGMPDREGECHQYPNRCRPPSTDRRWAACADRTATAPRGRCRTSTARRSARTPCARRIAPRRRPVPQRHPMPSCLLYSKLAARAAVNPQMFPRNQRSVHTASS
ncbi:hypothetical protein [Lysobacter gummosus]|uniref:hypothetical protein n=1 Tax=Lysobacter gummosus TaxID=262324 RepID=UPI00363E4201